MIATLAMVMVVAVIIAIVVVWNAFRSDAQQAAPPPEESSEPEPEPSEEPSAEPSASPTEPVKLINTDWRPAVSEKWGFVYEVPTSEEGWRVKGDGTIFGAGEDENGQPEVAMSGTSIYEESPCGDWGSRAAAGAQGITETEDTAEMAEGVAAKWGELGFETEAGGAPTVEVRSVEEYSANGLEGHRATVDVTLSRPDGTCEPPTAVVTTVVVPNPDEDNAVRAFTVMIDTGVSDAISEEEMDTIVNSLRDEDYEIE